MALHNLMSIQTGSNMILRLACTNDNENLSRNAVTVKNKVGDTMLFEKKIIWRLEDVAAFLGVSKGHIYNLVSASKRLRYRGIPFRKKGKLLFFLPSEIFDWINEGNLK